MSKNTRPDKGIASWDIKINSKADVSDWNGEYHLKFPIKDNI